jgi:hypothetical protein
MRPLHAALAAICLLGGAGARGAAAQEVWNDARTRALVLRAIERRAVQLADTGLRDYTARAHGYLTFLAQLGEGFPDPPAVIKSDELMLEVYWAAPDRSKQRVVGRRDTLLLPTDINYHRDHLGVVQNNFPAIIRLGDGDEVRDVPHPLSMQGLATYDYAITDSLAIRTAGTAIDVMMVKVRPKDDRVPAAVGAVYIDRISASVVRMTFSFTRAALRDRQLEDVSVILENGLVEGRFWLPRRQEIEIRRSASWMDFPARGIIRGRWEICCVETNAGLPASTFFGPEIVDAPRAEQRAYQFEGTILGTLPEEVRAFDDEAVRRVQEEARALVRAGALARVRSTSPSARGLSDVIRVNRVEGLAVGAGVTQRLGYGLSAAVRGRYGTADRRAKWQGSLDWRGARGFSVGVRGVDDFGEAGDAQEVSGFRNSIAAQEFGSDWTDPYGRRGGTLTLGYTGTTARAIALEVERMEERPLDVLARPVSGRYGPTLPADSVVSWAAALRWSVRWPTGARGEARQLTMRVGAARAEWAGSAETSHYARASLDMSAGRPWLGGQVVGRTLAAAVSRGRVPAQQEVRFGGPVTGPGYDFHSLRGRAGVSQRIEWQRQIPFVALDLGRFGRVPSTLTLAPFLHGVWIDGGSAGAAFHPSVGIGTLALFELLRVDVARTLRGRPRWMVSLDVTRDLWPVL